jgi:hypothetical protein
MKIRMATGLWRLWSVSSVIWVTCFAIFFASEYVAIPIKHAAASHTLRSNEPGDLSFDDVSPSPRYKPCYQTENIEISKLSDSALIQLDECLSRIDRFDLVKRALVTIGGVPLVVFLLGWSLLWIGRGFKPPTR